MVTQRIRLDMIPTAINPTVNVSQYDVGLRTLQFELFAGSRRVDVPEEAIVLLNGSKPDGTVFSYACTYSGNVVTSDVQEQMTVVHGTVECELRIQLGNSTIATTNFNLRVKESPYDSAKPSESELEGIQAIIDAGVEEATNIALTAAQNATASATEAQSYAVGGTNTRTGEDTDNAKYYKEQAETIKEQIAQAGALVVPTFSIDYDPTSPTYGHLISMTEASGITFSIENGHLFGELT